MDVLLGKITQHAVNYAIRSGIGITASYAIKQTSRLLKTVSDDADHQELRNLQERLDSKIRIISPAIDMIELISARGNTTLESAVALTKALRWEIQSLGNRLSSAASAEEHLRRGNARQKASPGLEAEIRGIVSDMRRLLARIEDAVPLINLAITTSGASLSTTLPASVSPSRLLQASTFLTAGDSQYSVNPSESAQVGPAFVLSLYMLFAGHAQRLNEDLDSARGSTWKEVIHKARIKLMRVPIQIAHGDSNGTKSAERAVPSTEKANEFAYQLEIIEDLNDDRVHSFEDDTPQPGSYGGVQLAGIREVLPIQQVSKIFYADTGKILGIGNSGEANSPVLLLKRDVNAAPPRRMMQDSEKGVELYHPVDVGEFEEAEEDSQLDIDQQLHQESLPTLPRDTCEERAAMPTESWRLPQDLDPEWLALEVYTEEEDSSSESEQEPNDDSAYESHRPSSSGEDATEADLAAGITNLHLNPPSSPSPVPTSTTRSQLTTGTPQQVYSPTNALQFGPIRSSLSLLEMLIRLTALQQFQQASHLSIPDELLTFFLEESSTTGAGGDGDERRRVRQEARRKVGFDPYDESPVKRRGEDYQYQPRQDGRDSYGGSVGGYSRSGTPYLAGGDSQYGFSSPRWPRERSMTPQESPATPEPWLLRSVEAPPSSSQRYSPDVLPSSPISSHHPATKKATRPMTRVQQVGEKIKVGSPLGRGMSVETDSTLGTSPGSPTLLTRAEKSSKGSALSSDSLLHE